MGVGEALGPGASARPCLPVRSRDVRRLAADANSAPPERRGGEEEEERRGGGEEGRSEEVGVRKGAARGARSRSAGGPRAAGAMAAVGGVAASPEVARLRAENARLRRLLASRSCEGGDGGPWAAELLAEARAESRDERRIFCLKGELCAAARRRRQLEQASH